MSKGNIFHFPDFVFHDGAHGDKLMVVLNEPQENEPYLMCKTTSQTRYGITTEGCRSDLSLFVTSRKPLNVKTWILFGSSAVYEFSQNDINEKLLSCEIRKIGCFEISVINSIVNCFKRSDDISKYHLQLLR